MMITKDDIVMILEENYKSSFDNASMDMLDSLISICVCACKSNVGVKDAEFLESTLKCIGIGWTIYALQIKDPAGHDKVKAFLEYSENLRRQGFQYFTEAEDIIKVHFSRV